MITRGATPTCEFTVTQDFTTATALYITYQQAGATVLEKTLEDCTVTATKISTRLTQEETLLFAESKPVRIQIRVKLADGSAHVSKPISTTASELLKEGTI